MKNNTYKIFKEMSSDQMKEIIKDIIESKKEGIRSEVLAIYAKEYFEDINSEFEEHLVSMSICLDIVKNNFIDALFDRILENDSLEI